MKIYIMSYQNKNKGNELILIPVTLPFRQIFYIQLYWQMGQVLFIRVRVLVIRVYTKLKERQ